MQNNNNNCVITGFINSSVSTHNKAFVSCLVLKKKKKNINQEAEQLNAEVFFFFGQMEPQQVSFNVSFWKVFLEGSYFSGLGWCVQVHVT